VPGVDGDPRAGAHDDAQLGDDGAGDVEGGAAAVFDVQVAAQPGQPGHVLGLAAAIVFAYRSAHRVDAEKDVGVGRDFGDRRDSVGRRPDRGVAFLGAVFVEQ
jgi:hypothetical protein